MRKFINLIVISFLFGHYSCALADDGKVKLGPELVNPGYHEPPPWFKNSFLDIREDVREASANKKRMMYFFFQDGCPYCAKLIDVNFSQKDIVDKTRKHFDVVAVNMWGDRDLIDMQGATITEKKYAEKLRVMFTPTLIFLDEEGNQALRVNGYFPPHKFMAALDYVIGKNEKKMPFKVYLEQMNPQASSGQLHTAAFIQKPPYDFSKGSADKKYRLVLFEQAECPSCDELHGDIFKRKESKALLDKFAVYQVNVWSKDKLVTPQGKTMTGAEWAKALDVKYTPSMLFFDAQGNEVIRMEAYLKSFHVQSVMDYVASEAYVKQPSFQRYIDVRADALREKGVVINLMQ